MSKIYGLSRVPGRRNIPMQEMAMQDHAKVKRMGPLVAVLERTVNDLAQRVAALEADREALKQAVTPPKRGPGRPRKNV